MEVVNELLADAETACIGHMVMGHLCNDGISVPHGSDGMASEHLTLSSCMHMR